MPTLGLSIIVKNEATTLRQCLQSVSGVVSQSLLPTPARPMGPPALPANSARL